MALKAAGADRTFAVSSPVDAIGADTGAQTQAAAGRYDLATALRVVRRIETSPGRAAVFAEITSKNRLIRLVDTLYARADARFVQPLLLFVFMLKSVLWLGPFRSADDAGAEAAAISTFPNEHRTIARVAGLIPDAHLMRLTSAPRHAAGRGQWASLRALLRASPRIVRFLRILVRRHSFMPAARIAAALAFYIRFSRLFGERPGLKAAIVTSNYSPEAVGMAAAAHHHGRRVIYANHAPVPANGAFVPPVLADCALFYGEAIRDTYERRSRCVADIALIGQPGRSQPMAWRDAVGTVGIFLTAGTRVDVLQSLVASIRLSLPAARIIIRQHPVSLLRTDFAAIGVQDMNTELIIGNPLDEEIAACDIVICGNSGVALNVVSGGRPVAYLSSLDGAEFDTNGFVQSRLVYAMPWWTDDLYSRLRTFYGIPGWRAVMQRYDAAYDADRSQLEREAGERLMRYLRVSGERSAGAVQPAALRA